MKLLLFRGSPRSNIEEVENENPKIMKECDILNVRYCFEFDAYKWARDYFLSHKEYDYLIIATDDIIVKAEHIRQLKEDLKEFKFAVISGMMNVDEKDYPNGNLNICSVLALKDKKLRHYDWLDLTRLPKDDIFLVKFAGFGLTAIRRDIVEMFPFATDSIFKGKGMQFGASLDFVFCWYCHEYNVPIYVDKRIFMHHLRTHGKHQAGERKKEIWLNDKMIQFGMNPL
jgi:hypothetical protein